MHRKPRPAHRRASDCARGKRCESPWLPAPRFDTHEVFNQSPPYENVDLFSSDAAAAGRGQGEWRGRRGAGARGLRQAMGHGGDVRARRGAPTRTRRSFTTFDAKGFRRDTVEFHPAYHQFMRESVAAGLHASTWTAAGERARGAGRGGARGALLHGGAGRDRTSVPDHDDARGAGGARRRAGAAGQSRAEGRHAAITTRCSGRGGTSPA